jgi:hypothetical protein
VLTQRIPSVPTCASTNATLRLYVSKANPAPPRSSLRAPVDTIRRKCFAVAVMLGLRATETAFCRAQKLAFWRVVMRLWRKRLGSKEKEAAAVRGRAIQRFSGPPPPRRHLPLQAVHPRPRNPQSPDGQDRNERCLSVRHSALLHQSTYKVPRPRSNRVSVLHR